MITPEATIAIIINRLAKLNNRVNSEYDLQRAVAALLPEAVREHHLSRVDRVDFWLDGIAIECKVKGTAAEIARQLLRYEPYADGIILICTKAFPDDQKHLFESINKPFAIICPLPF